MIESMAKEDRMIESIVKRVQYSPKTEIIDYQPGNCTRYLVQFTEVSDPEVSKLLGMGGEPGWIITHLNNNTSNVFVLPSYCGFVFPHEVRDKMNERLEGDAYELAKLIAHVCGMEFGG